MKKTIICVLAIVQCYLTTAQNVGVGITTPHSSAALHINSTTKGLLIPRMSTAERNAIAAPAEGLLIYNLTTNELNQRQNSAWKTLLNNDSWTGGGSGWIFNIGDNVGINTAGPSERLDVSGNIRSNSSVIIDNAAAILQLKSAGVSTGFVQLSGDNLRFGTNSGNTNGRMIMRFDGSDMFSFQKTAPGGSSVQMSASNVPVGLLEATTSGNVSLTAVNDNTQVQLGGEVFINNFTNRTGIGTSSPTERLHVNGKLKVSGTEMTIDDGRITGTTTSSAYNLLPLAYGRVTYLGNKAGGTPNFTSVTRTGPGAYDVFVTGLTSSSVIMVTPGSISSIEMNYDSPGKFRVRLWSSIFDEFDDCDFHFVIYNP
ncbi:MAG: hypothetical protein J0L56_08645 [Chitinophagales bacterium]|nr:hypothetical protein [Chitinophagales bacterium]